MITVRKEFVYKLGEGQKAREVATKYKETFDPSSSCRIYKQSSGTASRIIMEDDYESFADYEAKWSERTATPEFKMWLKEWYRITVEGSLEFNFLRTIE